MYLLSKKTVPMPVMGRFERQTLSEIIATHDQISQTKFMQLRYYKQKPVAYAESENN